MTARRGLAVVAGLAAAVAVLVAGAALGALQLLRQPHAGWAGPAVDVVLEPGLDAGTMLDRLAAAGVVRRPRLVRAWLALRGGGERLRAGEYRFSEPLSALDVVRRLQSGDVLLHQVTIPEGLTLRDTVRTLVEAGFGSQDALEAAFRDPAPIADLDPRAPDLEGYLFPETYRFPRGAGPAEIAVALTRQFRLASGADYVEAARALGLDLRQAVTLASLIEKETSVAEERPRIARVFHNRLERGMKLECDPTVRYALEREDRPVARLTQAHLAFESPWNTYRVAGLPPGPIASPGRASLRAAVAPAAGNDLYFVAAPGGGHRFSEHLADHLRAVAEWRRYVRSSR